MSERPGPPGGRSGPRVSLPRKMAIGLVAGAGLGVAAHLAAAGEPWLDSLVEGFTDPAGQLFLRMLFALVIPLIVSALPLGVAGLGDLGRLGRLGLRTLAYTVTTSVIAVSAAHSRSVSAWSTVATEMDTASVKVKCGPASRIW